MNDTDVDWGSGTTTAVADLLPPSAETQSAQPATRRRETINLNALAWSRVRGLWWTVGVAGSTFGQIAPLRAMTALEWVEPSSSHDGSLRDAPSIASWDMPDVWLTRSLADELENDIGPLAEPDDVQWVQVRVRDMGRDEPQVIID
jgi:hypothetical protein